MKGKGKKVKKIKGKKNIAGAGRRRPAHLV
jgi:hypothetical protein